MRLQPSDREYCAILNFHGRWLTAADNGSLVCTATVLDEWERFTIEFVPGRRDAVHFRSTHGPYMVAEEDGRILANRPAPSAWETFVLVPTGPTTFALRVSRSVLVEWYSALPNHRKREVVTQPRRVTRPSLVHCV